MIPSFKVGDKVRLKMFKTIFSKGDEIKYSKDYYLTNKREERKYLVGKRKKYSANKIRKVNDIIEYKPQNEE